MRFARKEKRKPSTAARALLTRKFSQLSAESNPSDHCLRAAAGGRGAGWGGADGPCVLTDQPWSSRRWWWTMQFTTTQIAHRMTRATCARRWFRGEGCLYVRAYYSNKVDEGALCVCVVVDGANNVRWLEVMMMLRQRIPNRAPLSESFRHAS